MTWSIDGVFHVQERGCDSFILDLRNNPGGLVRAGLDIARLWLPGEAAILTVEGRDVAGTAAVLQVDTPPPPNPSAPTVH